MRVLVLAILSAFVMVGCISCSSTPERGIQKHTGFTELKFPSNSLAPGQIVEIYSRPQKLEITHDPQIPWDQVSTSPGWDVSNANFSDLQASIGAEVAEVAKANGSANSEYKAVVRITDTQTALVPKHIIYAALKTSIKSDDVLREQIEDYSESGTHFDVITSVLTATVSFSILDSSNTTMQLDADLVEALNSKLGFQFKYKDGEAVAVSGKQLIIGVHYDPKMVGLLLKKI